MAAGLAICKLLGKLSVNEARVIGEPVGLARVKTKLAEPPSAIDEGENNFVKLDTTGAAKVIITVPGVPGEPAVPLPLPPTPPAAPAPTATLFGPTLNVNAVLLVQDEPPCELAPVVGTLPAPPAPPTKPPPPPPPPLDSDVPGFVPATPAPVLAQFASELVVVFAEADAPGNWGEGRKAPPLPPPPPPALIITAPANDNDDPPPPPPPEPVGNGSIEVFPAPVPP